MSEVEELTNTLGEISYLQSFNDLDMDIEEPDQFIADVFYPTDQFEKLCTLVRMENCNIAVDVAFYSPKSDLSGYIAMFDLKESATWPVKSIYFKSKVGKA